MQAIEEGGKMPFELRSEVWYADPNHRVRGFGKDLYKAAAESKKSMDKQGAKKEGEYPYMINKKLKYVKKYYAYNIHAAVGCDGPVGRDGPQ